MRYRVNIHRPNIQIDQNKRLCEYIEPLREQNRVNVSDAYLLNLSKYKNNEECIHIPGSKYYFWFINKVDAEQFIIDWQELAINGIEIKEWYDNNVKKHLKETNDILEKYNWLTKIVEVD